MRGGSGDRKRCDGRRTEDGVSHLFECIKLLHYFFPTHLMNELMLAVDELSACACVLRPQDVLSEREVIKKD